MLSRVCLLSLFVVANVVSPAHARTRLVRTMTADDGLAAPDVRALAQDSHGFLWIGTTGGLTRYDGRQLTPWAPDLLNDHIPVLAPGPDGSLVAAVSAGAAYRITHDGAIPLPGPDGRTLSDVDDLLFDIDGRLWVCQGKTLWMRATDGAWSRPVADPALERESPHVLRQGADGHIYVGTRSGAWRLDGADARRLLTTDTLVVDIDATAAGSVHVLTWTGDVWRIDSDRAERVFEGHERGIALARRSDTLWVAYAPFLVSLRPGLTPEVLATTGAGGPLLVDREGSLWMGTFHGLRQYPEPDTRVWDTTDGLTKAHTRYLAHTPGAVWFSAWNEPFHRIDVATDTMVPIPASGRPAGGMPCVDGDGVLWMPAGDRLLAWRDGQVDEFPYPAPTDATGCATAPDGSVWLGTQRGLYFVPRGGTPVFRGSLPAGDRPSVNVPYEDRAGTLWASTEEHVCATPAHTVRAGRDALWSCQTVPGMHHARDMIETPSGALWLATAHRGILQWDGSGWVDVASSQQLAGRSVFALARSEDAGVWIASAGSVVRVAPAPTPEAPWKVLERLSSWNGLVSSGAGDVLEADGAVWLATSAGVVHVPPSARTTRRPPPEVTIVDVRALGKAIAPAGAATLPYRNNHLELGFAGPTFRDPTLLRFRMRLRPTDAWSQPTSQSAFHFVRLPPGNYTVEVEATLDDLTWSPSAAAFQLRILRPWYLEPWVWALGALTIALVILAIHRARLAVSLRMERQRLRIAMDLHDEMGSGLGSIALLAGLATDGELDRAEARSVTSKISDTASQLGGSLTDIVWSLRQGSGKLERLAAYLAERGAGLFPGDRPQFETDFPDAWPRAEVSLPVRRSLQLIALEAMHNAAKHADADRVVLGLRCHQRAWTLWVEDDGRGLHPSTPRIGGGNGLTNMRKRAETVGAELSIGPAAADGTGTRVCVVFAHARDTAPPPVGRPQTNTHTMV